MTKNRSLWKCQLPLYDDPVANPSLQSLDYDCINADNLIELSPLLLAAFQGTTDDEGEDLQAARHELHSYLHRVDTPCRLELSRVARREGRVVGACLVSDWTVKKAPMIAYIFVAPEWKQKGLGRELVTRSLLAMEQQGETEVLAMITHGNLPSERLFASLGFQKSR